MKRRHRTVGDPDLRSELQKRLTHPIAPTLTAELVPEEWPRKTPDPHRTLAPVPWCYPASFMVDTLHFRMRNQRSQPR